MDIDIDVGRNGRYCWMQTSSDHPVLDALLQHCPEVVLGKHVAITSFDTARLQITEASQRVGWAAEDGVAISPPVHDVGSLPISGSEEWYVFPEHPQFPRDHEVFANYGVFYLASPPNWWLPIHDRFWSQIERIDPESYMTHGDTFVFVTRDATLFDSVCGLMAQSWP